MKHFTDRVFYLDGTDELVHVRFLTSGNWVMYLLSDRSGWEWEVALILPTYEDVFSRIRRYDPQLLLQEEWA
jgi:hypothetical protein